MQPMKRMSPRPMSPKMLSWNKKLAMWRKNHRRADGSLPSLKAAMKACKGRRVSTKRCRRRRSFRKHRVASPKRTSPLRKASAQMKAKLSPKRTGLKVQSAQKKQRKPAVFGQKAPANPMFVPGTVKKQQSPAAQKKQQKPAQKKQQSPAAQKKQQKQQKQQKPAQKKQQSPAAQKKQQKQQKPAQKKPQFGPNARQGAMFGRPARFA